MHKDLLSEIFKRLPIETVCRFRCICKSWNSLTSSPFFVDLHHSFPRHLKQNLYRRLTWYRSYWDWGIFFKLISPHLIFNSSVKHSTLKQPLHFPFPISSTLFLFLGVIHGVVCFAYNCSSSFSIVLWNPKIHKYVTLSHPKMPDARYSLAFGYDDRRKDFKVVVVQFSHWTYKVYSTQKGGWSGARSVKFNSISRRTPDGIEPLTWHLKRASYNKPCFINGTIHWTLWLCYRHNRGLYHFPHSVLMFDCEAEEFRRMTVPANLFFTRPVTESVWVLLFEYGGMLAILIHRRDVWVMQEHGVTTSWKYLVDAWETTNEEYHLLSMLQRGTEHVYDESMLLMDHPKTQSYTNQEKVTILSS